MRNQTYKPDDRVEPHILDLLTAAELGLIILTLDIRLKDLRKMRDDSLQFAAELEREPQRAQLYQDLAADDEARINELTVLAAKLDRMVEL